MFSVVCLFQISTVRIRICLSFHTYCRGKSKGQSHPWFLHLISSLRIFWRRKCRIYSVSLYEGLRLLLGHTAVWFALSSTPARSWESFQQGLWAKAVWCRWVELGPKLSEEVGKYGFSFSLLSLSFFFSFMREKKGEKIDIGTAWLGLVCAGI